MSRQPRVWLVDGYYQIFRSYYSMPDLRASDGTPVGALRGYASTLIKFLREQRPTHAGVAWDHAFPFGQDVPTTMLVCFADIG